MKLAGVVVHVRTCDQRIIQCNLQIYTEVTDTQIPFNELEFPYRSG